jgi:hypothetical protein
MTFVWKVNSDVIDDVGNGSDCVGRCIYHRSHSFDGKGREVTSGNREFFLIYTLSGFDLTTQTYVQSPWWLAETIPLDHAARAEK